MRKLASLLPVLMLLCTFALAQTRTVTGRVMDDKGESIPFATITESGTKNAAKADANGLFSIRIKEGSQLIISSAGFNSQTVTPAATGAINVNLATKQAELKEVVVTAALGQQKLARQLGYSATTIQSKDIVATKPISVANGLTGKAAGLQINSVNNGLFAPTRITLRGNRSLTGNNQPLIVVDGAIFNNDLSTINTEDIADVNILKGSSASAIYGSDASNGVIVINTKRGTRGKPQVNFSTTVQVESLAYLPELQNRFGSNGGEKFVNDFNDLSTYIPYENQSYGPEYNGRSVPLGRPISDGTTQMVPYTGQGESAKKKFFDKGVTTQNNFSYMAGDENSRFYMSLQDINTRAIMPGDKGRRDVFRVGGSKTYGIFSANYSMSYTYKTTDYTNTGLVYELVMNTPAHVPLTQFKDWGNDRYSTPDGYYNDYFDNPWWIIGNNRQKNTDHNLTGNVQFNLKPLSWLNLSYRLAASNLSNRYEFKNSPKSFSDFTKTNNVVLYSNPSGTGVDSVIEAPKYITVSEGNASYGNSTYSNFLLTSDFIASIDKKLSQDFNLSASLGTTYVGNKISGIAVSGPLVVPVYNINNVQGVPTLGGGNSFREARKLGLFGEATVGFRNYAFLHGSYRSDIDSRLSEDNRWIPYYDIDAALVLSDLIAGLKDNKTLTYLKVRAAHSVTGNASALGGGSPYLADGAYIINPTYTVAGGFPYGSLGGYNLSTLIANPNLKPEQVEENEVGLEIGFLNRFYLVAAAYQSELTDGIVTANTASSTGSYNALLNAANTRNKGLELELKSAIIKNKDWTWNLNINYTHYESKVISINGDVKSLGIAGANANAYAVVGQPYPVIESRDWVRDDQGRVIVSAVTGNPTRDPNLKVLGNATPTDILGLTTNLTWKNLTFTATADYRGGYKIFNTIGQYMDFTGIASTTAITGRQRFVFPNSVYDDGTGKYVTNTNVTVDDANFNFWPGLYRSVGANYVVSAAAWKLREAAISYEIPRNIYAPTKIVQRATLTVSGRNLIMLRPKTNVWTDPEFSEDTGNGVGRTSESQAPPSRIFSATLSITF
jgi:TonB-linked SusC/RagA family outer membrane protein